MSTPGIITLIGVGRFMIAVDSKAIQGITTRTLEQVVEARVEEYEQNIDQEIEAVKLLISSGSDLNWLLAQLEELRDAQRPE